MDRQAFLDQEPPPGYVAGIGRGATGFSTGADTKPVRFEDDVDDDDNLEREEADNDNGLLSSKQNNNDEDDEADRIYAEIDRKLSQKSGAKLVEAKKEEEETDLIREQFADLKRELSTVKQSEWENLPDVADFTRRNKRMRLIEQQQQRTYAIPDSIIAGGGAGKSIDQATDFHSISIAKGNLLTSQLDSMVSTSDDKTEELNKELAALEERSQNLQDLNKGRLILSSLRKSEPNKPNSWLASCRLEEQAKNYNQAKALIAEGCHRLPRSEELWLENIRIHQKTAEGSRKCKSIINEALHYSSKSEKLWMKAYDLENSTDTMSKRRILMKAIEFIPTSAKLWKLLINIEEDEADVKKMLNKAVELCPKEWEFWMTLLNLSKYSDAKLILNRARKTMSDSYLVWLAALKLEERENDNITVEKLARMLAKGFKELEKHSESLLTRELWLDEAVKADSEGFNKTAESIVITCLKQEETSINECFQLADSRQKEHENIAHYIYRYVIDKFPENIESWLHIFRSLKEGNKNLPKLFSYYSQSLAVIEDNELLPLMYAKDKWVLGKDVDGARQILANYPNNKSEAIYLARVKLELKENCLEDAYKLSQEAISKLDTVSERFWIKHIHLQRFLNYKGLLVNDIQEVLATSSRALDSFPLFYKLYLQKSQILLDMKDPKAAREVLSVGSKKCDRSAEIFISMASIDEVHLNSLIRARSTLEMGILKNPKSEDLWVAKIKLERHHKDAAAARQLVNRALKIFPSSPTIWIQNLALIPKMSRRKPAFLDSLKHTNNSPEVLLSIGVFFWIDGKFSKAKSWFKRSLDADKTNGESWGWSFCFMKKHGTSDELDGLVAEFKDNYEDINKGAVWNSVNKDVKNTNLSAFEVLEIVSDELLKGSETF